MSETISVEGVRELRLKLTRGKSELRVHIKDINFAAALAVARGANAFVPVGDPVTDPHPGRLAKSIRARATLRSGIVTAGNGSTPYAPPIHWGWPSHNIEANKFIYRAFDAERPSVLTAYEAAVHELVVMVNG